MKCRLERLSDYYWYPTLEQEWGKRTMFVIVWDSETRKPLRFRQRSEAREVIDKWTSQGAEQLRDTYGLLFDIRNNLNSDFTI